MCIVICTLLLSRPARGAWVEIMYSYFNPNPAGRAPQGARGLKSTGGTVEAITAASRPARGAWVEIENLDARHHDELRRAPQGARGLKSLHRS